MLENRDSDLSELIMYSPPVYRRVAQRSVGEPGSPGLPLEKTKKVPAKKGHEISKYPKGLQDSNSARSYSWTRTRFP